MKIYLDVVFFINFVIDFFILFGVSKVLKNNISIIKLIIGSVVGSLSILILFFEFSSFIIFLYKIFISILMIVISFGKNNLFKNLLYFYLISIILGGCFYLFDITSTYKNTGMFIINNSLVFNFIILIVGSPIIIYLFVKECISYKNNYSNKYLVDIYINNNLYKFSGFIDTGNRLKDPYKGRSIILVNYDFCVSKYIYVPYHALNYNGVIQCIKPDKVIIDNKEFNNCLIGLSKDKFNIDKVNCILPNKFKEDL